MKKSRVAVENEAKAAAERALNRLADDLKRAGLVVREPLITRRDGNKILSELEISFFDGTNLVDHIEFFAWENGESSASAESIETWLHGEITATIEDHLNGNIWGL